MKANPFNWVEIYVNDMNRAKKFYGEVFKCDFKLINPGPEIEMWGFPSDLNIYGASGALCKMEGFGGGRGSSVIPYFSSEDNSVEEKRIVKAGGKIQKARFSIGEYGFIVLGIDTEGNIFGIQSMK